MAPKHLGLNSSSLYVEQSWNPQSLLNSVADPERFDADRDPTFQSDADPDPKFV